MNKFTKSDAAWEEIHETIVILFKPNISSIKSVRIYSRSSERVIKNCFVGLNINIFQMTFKKISSNSYFP